MLSTCRYTSTVSFENTNPAYLFKISINTLAYSASSRKSMSKETYVYSLVQNLLSIETELIKYRLTNNNSKFKLL